MDNGDKGAVTTLLEAKEKVRYSRLNRFLEDRAILDLHCNTFWKKRFFVLLASSIVTLTVMIVAGTTLYRSGMQHSCPHLARTLDPGIKFPYTPAPVKYLNKFLTDDPETPKFMGQPRPEMDEAWHALLSATALRFSEEELRQAGNATSVEHKDGGYIGGLGLSHSLHCIKRIKQYLHPEYYYKHQEQDWRKLYLHLDHCLESLRQSAMCMPDLSIYTFRWTPASRVRPVVETPQRHACVDWQALHTWMNARAASYDDLVPPPDELYTS